MSFLPVTETSGLDVKTALGGLAGGTAFEVALALIPGAAILVAAGFAAGARAATLVREAPMVLASVDDASLHDLSRIACCLASSFARIETRSSGIGLFS